MTTFKPGVVVGRLTLLSSFMSTDGKGRRYWNACCSCGGVARARQDYLLLSIREGFDAGCGCVQREAARRGNSHRTHGLTNSPTWNSYQSMMKRCYRPQEKAFRDYGAKGITVCDEWRGDFESFVRDMGLRPPGTTLDRRENSVGYSKANCRWATKLEQMSNRTNNRRVAAFGTVKTLAEWSRHLRIQYDTVKHYLNSGLTISQISQKFHPVARRQRSGHANTHS